MPSNDFLTRNTLRFEFRQLKYFLAIVEEGSIRKAAERLGMSQPPLSRQIQQLEAGLKVELFERTGRGMILTGAGQAMVAHARSLLERASQAQKDIHDGSDDPLRRLTIGYLDDFMNGFVSKLLVEFVQSNPTVRLRSQLSVTWNILAEIKAGRMDVGFISLPLPISASQLSVIRFPPIPIVAVVHKGHPLAARESVDISEFRNDRIIYPTVTPESGFAQQVYAMFHRVGFTPDVQLEAWPTDHIAMFVANGLGITLTTSASVTAYRDDLAFLKVNDPDAQVHPAVVWRAGGVSRTISEFLDLCRAYRVKR